MCHAVAAAAPAVHCNGIQPYKGAAWEEGRLLLLSSGGVINYLALWSAETSLNTMLMLLARASVSPSHSCSARSHKCDLDGCSPIIVLIVFHHCLELLSPILLTLDW